MLITCSTLLFLFYEDKKYQRMGSLHGPMQASKMAKIAALAFNAGNS